MLDSKKSSLLIPELSDNLHFNKLSDNEYILSNSVNRHYLKINNDVYNLLCLIDGKKSIDSIMTEYNELNYSKLNIQGLHTLLYEKLVVYGILKGYDNKIKEYQKPSYLKISFIIINEKMLSKITKKIHFLFNKKIALAILFLSFFVIASQLYYNYSTFKTFNLQESIVYFFVVMALSVTFHEIGHATAADFFGAKHGGIGGGFYIFRPVYFADVTDIWKLNSTKRIVVNLSGMYFEIIFGSILSIIAYCLSNNTLLLISLVVCVKTFFNLNPFLRSDGYWVLSDALGKPNLMAHGFNKIKQIFKPKERWKKTDYFLLVYGLISYSLLMFFLYFVLVKNPDSILYFPKNLADFIQNLFSEKAQFSLAKLGKLFIPMLFFYLVFGFAKSFFPMLKRVTKKHYSKYKNKHPK
jgi:putative peptide zinc metalloprotease protein